MEITKINQIYEDVLYYYIKKVEGLKNYYNEKSMCVVGEEYEQIKQTKKERIDWHMKRIHWLRKKCLSLSGLIEVGLACPYCGKRTGSKELGCCGESRDHFETLFIDVDVKYYSNSDLEELYGFSE